MTMCRGDGCPIKNTCLRYRARPKEQQPFFRNSPYSETGCKHFWKYNERKVLVPLLLALVLIGCSKAPPAQALSQDPPGNEFIELKARFYSDAKRHGISLLQRSTVYSLRDDVTGWACGGSPRTKTQRPTYIACQSPGKIEFETQYWREASLDKREELFYHETWHLHGLPHNDAKLAIMNSALIDPTSVYTANKERLKLEAVQDFKKLNGIK